MDMLVAGAKVVIGIVASLWLGLHPLVQLLLVLMVMDIISGIIAAGQAGLLNSDRSYVGMRKKVMVLLLVGVSTLIEPYVGLSVAAVVAGFYCVHEMLSVLENADALGLPIPGVLSDALAKLSTEKPATEVSEVPKVPEDLP